MGEPTKSIGRSSFTFCIALSLMIFESKSQSLPSASAVVKSDAKPGMIFNFRRSLVAAVTLGRE